MAATKKLSDRLDQYILELMKVCDIKEVYLFGSAVSGQGLEGSDIDIAIVSDNFNADNVIDYMTRFLLLTSGLKKPARIVQTCKRAT